MIWVTPARLTAAPAKAWTVKLVSCAVPLTIVVSLCKSSKLPGSVACKARY